MALTSAREKRLWLQAALVQVAIYASLAYVRTPTTWLRERNLLRLTVGALFLVAAALILWRVGRRRPGVRELLVLAVFGAVYVYVLQGMRFVEERVHFLEYGLVGGLVYAALRERRANLLRAGGGPLILTRLPAAAAMAITGLLGWGDEGIQALLPDRYYELRDVGMNVVAGILVVAAMAALRWAGSGKGESPPL